MKLVVIAVAVSSLAVVGCAQSNVVEHPNQPGEPGFNIDMGFGGGFAGPQPSFGPTVSATTPPPPLSGGTLLMLADGKTALAADPDRDLAYLVDLGNAKLSSTVTLTAGDEPGRAVEDGAGKVHLVLRRARRGGDHRSGDGDGDRAQGGLRGATRHRVRSGDRSRARRVRRRRIGVAAGGGRRGGAHGHARARSARRRRRRRPAVGLDVPHGAGDSSSTATAPWPIGSSLPHDFSNFMGESSPSVAWRMMSMPGGHVGIAHQRGSVGPVQTTQGGYGGPGGPAAAASCRARSASSTAQRRRSRRSASATSYCRSICRSRPRLSSSPCSRRATRTRRARPDRVHVDGRRRAAATRYGRVGPTAAWAAAAVSSTTAPSLSTARRHRSPSTPASRCGCRRASRRRCSSSMTDFSRKATVSLSTDSRADTGWAVFHSNSGASIACASCHPEGGEDARVWEFDALGPRRTQSLRGHVGGTEPFHWGGELPNFDSLVGEVYMRRMAGPLLAQDQKQVLFSWINAIPSLPASPVADAAAVARGKALFEDTTHAACTSCHSGPELTNNGGADVGTGGHVPGAAARRRRLARAVLARWLRVDADRSLHQLRRHDRPARRHVADDGGANRRPRRLPANPLVVSRDPQRMSQPSMMPGAQPTARLPMRTD